MLRFLVPLIFILSSATSMRNRLPPHQLSFPSVQVASESQVKFALENKYDDTGPGAKQPEFAYNTYNNLEDALVAYLDDPDTKLPEHERAKAISKLQQSPQYYTTPNAGRLFLKNNNYKLFEKPQFRPRNYDTYNFPLVYSQDPKAVTVTVPKRLDGNEVLTQYQIEKKSEPFRFHKVHTVKSNPLSLAHYTRDQELAQIQYNLHPNYEFSYAVNDKTTGDKKTVQESRDGSTVHGFYSFIDADGKTRTVHYTADDLQGFRPTVQNPH